MMFWQNVTHQSLGCGTYPGYTQLPTRDWSLPTSVKAFAFSLFPAVLWLTLLRDGAVQLQRRRRRSSVQSDCTASPIVVHLMIVKSCFFLSASSVSCGSTQDAIPVEHVLPECCSPGNEAPRACCQLKFVSCSFQAFLLFYSILQHI